MLAQQLPGARIEDPDPVIVPLHLHAPADQAGRNAVISRFDFDTAVQVHGTVAVAVAAERLERQRHKRGLLFGEHGRHLPLGGAVNARVGPALLPLIEIALRGLQRLEAQAFQGCLLRMGDAAFDLALAVRIAHPAGHRHHAIVRQ